ncbi:MAG: YbjN domain-containing protein [Desulfotomaculales bacterium]
MHTRDLRRLFGAPGGGGSLTEAVDEFLKAQHLECHRPRENVFLVPVRADEGGWQVLIIVDELRSFIVVLSTLPVSAPPDRRADTAVLLNHINWTLAVGNYELDASDGEVRFRTSVDLEHAPEAAKALMKQLFGLNVATVGRHYHVLISFLTNPRMSVEDAWLLLK